MLVEFFYNLTFNKNSPYKSYSLKFRPDYTLCIKYGGHEYFIHFDAKYKSKGIPNEYDFNKRDHMYKFEDVYKMHTYKDAILKTEGAYVLYPGEFPKIFRINENDLIPSVGAFPLTPGKNGDEEECLRSVILDAIDNIINRQS